MSNEKNEKNEKKKRAPSPRDVWRLMMAVIGVVAVIQELRKPSQQRRPMCSDLVWTPQVAPVQPQLNSPNRPIGEVHLTLLETINFEANDRGKKGSTSSFSPIDDRTLFICLISCVGKAVI
jgi:hypothetical protein